MMSASGPHRSTRRSQCEAIVTSLRILGLRSGAQEPSLRAPFSFASCQLTPPVRACDLVTDSRLRTAFGQAERELIAESIVEAAVARIAVRKACCTHMYGCWKNVPGVPNSATECHERNGSQGRTRRLYVFLKSVDRVFDPSTSKFGGGHCTRRPNVQSPNTLPVHQFRPGSKRGQAPLCKAPFGPFRQRSTRFKTGSGTVVQSTLRAVPATVPDPVLNQALSQTDVRPASFLPIDAAGERSAPRIRPAVEPSRHQGAQQIDRREGDPVLASRT